MDVPLLDLKAQYRTIRAEIEAAVAEVFESQSFILGPMVERCEREIAAYTGCRHAIGMSSGTDALIAALMALDLEPGDEVIAPSYSFFATAGSIWRLGARPVFVDVEAETFNIAIGQVEAAITARTKAIVPVHLFGRMADMEALTEISKRHGIPLIEDAAQAIGASDRGRAAGSIGAMGCFSFFPSKNLGCAGDGGMVTTNDDVLAERLRMLRGHGSKVKYQHDLVGGNFRLDALQAAVVSVKLKHLDGWTRARQRNAERYERLFAAAGLAPGSVELPNVSASAEHRHVVNQYVIRVRTRDALRDFLRERGVGTEVYYPTPLHLQPCFASLGHRPGALPESERASRETLALPIYPELDDAKAAFVVERIAEFFARAGEAV